MSGRFELTDAEYVKVALLLPPAAWWALAGSSAGHQRDRVPATHGLPWRDVPERYGPWKTPYKRFAGWQEDGTWERIEGVVQADADAAGDLDWNRWIVYYSERGGRSYIEKFDTQDAACRRVLQLVATL